MDTISHQQPEESRFHLQNQDFQEPNIQEPNFQEPNYQEPDFQEPDPEEREIQKPESNLVAELKAKLEMYQANSQIDLILLKAQEEELTRYRRQIHAMGLELESWKKTIGRLKAGLEEFLIEDMAR